MSAAARLSLRGQLALNALAASVLAVVLAASVLVPAVYRAAAGQRAETAAIVAEISAAAIASSCAGREDADCESIGAARAVDGRSVVEARVLAAPERPEPGRGQGVAQLAGGARPRWLVVTLAAPDGRRESALLRLAVALAAMGEVLIFLLLYGMLVRTVAAPADRLLAATERVGRDDEGPLLAGAGTVLGRLGAAFERMGERLALERHRVDGQVDELRQVNRQLASARDAVVRQEKLATVGRLAAGVAHEVGNPLAAILGYLEIMRLRPDAVAEYLPRLDRETQRIDRILRDLLDFARPGDRQPHAVSVAAVAEGTVRLLQTQKRFRDVEVRLSLLPGLPPVLADEHHLQQILLNLLLNAADAMHGAGSVDVTAEAIPGDPGRAGCVAIVIEDRGPGIPEASLSRIFDPFFTTKEPGQGTGLGLSICHSLVESFGGTLRAANREGGGASLRVELPTVAAEAEVGAPGLPA